LCLFFLGNVLKIMVVMTWKWCVHDYARGFHVHVDSRWSGPRRCSGHGLPQWFCFFYNWAKKLAVDHFHWVSKAGLLLITCIADFSNKRTPGVM
jgi:hypothetical protein